MLYNVCAPDAREENAEFCETIDIKRMTLSPRCTDFMLGDFNVTEDKIDRAPAHDGDKSATDALRNLCHILNLQGSWRHTFPDERSFTSQANTSSGPIQSRLDRIYTTIAKHGQIVE